MERVFPLMRPLRAQAEYAGHAAGRPIGVPDFLAANEGPETTLPVPDSPERKLLCAVLEDAFRILQKHEPGTVRVAGGSKVRGLYEETLAWLESSTRTHPFDFERICEALGMDPQWLRGEFFEHLAARESVLPLARSHEVRTPGVVRGRIRRGREMRSVFSPLYRGAT